MILLLQDFILDGAAFRAWNDYWISVLGFLLAGLASAITLGSPNQSWQLSILKYSAIVCAASTLPMAMNRIGLQIAIWDHETLVHINMLGTLGALLVMGLYRIKSQIEEHESLRSGATSDERTTEYATVPGGIANHEQQTIAANILTTARNLISGSPHKTNPGIQTHPDTHRIVPANTNTAATITPPGPHTQTSEYQINFPLQSDPYWIGRSSSNSLTIDDTSISNTHAYITKESEGYVLYDAESMNGTSLEGKRVTRAVINPGASRLMIGNRQITLDWTNSTLQDVPSAQQRSLISESSDPMPTNIGTHTDTQSVVLVGTSGVLKGKHYGITLQGGTIGRSSRNAINVPDISVSRCHAKLSMGDEGWIVSDLGSASGTFINGSAIPGYALTNGATIRAGNSTLVYNRLIGSARPDTALITRADTITTHQNQTQGILTVTEGPDAGVQFKLQDGQNTIGRGDSNMIDLTDPAVSRDHCTIRVTESVCTVFDSGSASGTHISSENAQVAGIFVQTGDKIAIGNSEFTVNVV